MFKADLISLMIVTLLASPAVSQNSFADKVMKADRDVKLLNEGFKEEDIKTIDAMSISLLVNRYCGEEYASKQKFSELVVFLAKRMNVPASILADKIDEASKIRAEEIGSDTASKIRLCRTVKNNEGFSKALKN